jgi:hypothetical protein
MQIKAELINFNRDSGLGERGAHNINPVQYWLAQLVLNIIIDANGSKTQGEGLLGLCQILVWRVLRVVGGWVQLLGVLWYF